VTRARVEALIKVTATGVDATRMMGAQSRGELPLGVGPLTISPGRYVDYFRASDAAKIKTWLKRNKFEIELG
jgi:hypothetical protein